MKITFSKMKRADVFDTHNTVQVFADGENIGELRKARADAYDSEVENWEFSAPSAATDFAITDGETKLAAAKRDVVRHFAALEGRQ